MKQQKEAQTRDDFNDNSKTTLITQSPFPLVDDQSGLGLLPSLLCLGFKRVGELLGAAIGKK
jgi:hypothetical protein